MSEYIGKSFIFKMTDSVRRAIAALAKEKSTKDNTVPMADVVRRALENDPEIKAKMEELKNE